MFLLQVLSMSLSHYPMPLHHEHCASDANATWTDPGGISEGKSEKAGTQHKPKRIIQKGMPHTLRPPE